MIRLLETLEIMRARGYVVTLPKGVDGFPMARWMEEKPSQAEWDLFAKVEPFVFSSQPPQDRTLDAAMAEMSYREGFDDKTSLDAPFPVFSVEYMNGDPLDMFLMVNGTFRETLCIIVIEILPKQYGYYALCRDSSDSREPLKVFKSNMEGRTVSMLLERLRVEKTGLEVTRTSVRLGSGKNKRLHRIRRIVHVWPKKLVKAYPLSRELTIDWSHRWSVRGHWVSLPGRLGKDREGNYCVRDWTWRAEYVKGPKHLPLINKVRVVDVAKKDDDE